MRDINRETRSVSACGKRLNLHVLLAVASSLTARIVFLNIVQGARCLEQAVTADSRREGSRLVTQRHHCQPLLYNLDDDDDDDDDEMCAIEETIVAHTHIDYVTGVICSSAGNHAQAVSYHATRLGINGTCMRVLEPGF